MANLLPPVDSEIIKAHILKSYDSGNVSTEPWRSLPEIPSAAEIMGIYESSSEAADCENLLDKLPNASTALPRNKVIGPWKDTASYIAAHYRLLREDSLFPLRKAVADVKAAPSMRDSLTTAIYTHVHIIGVTLTTQGPAIKVEFSYENAGKKIRWEQSERLQQGTIVALTTRNDMFSTICRVAVVAARPFKNGVELNPPRVDLFWADCNDAEFDPTTNWVMVEARSGYWESFRHMGVALQKLRSESFPLSKYLAGLQKTIDTPSHINHNPLANLTALVSKSPEDSDEYPELQNVNVLESWPQLASDLDESQLEATKRVLTKQLAIIQGPPGTGKTFVSITSLRVMLDNWVAGDPPIIVSAQTNHALDQLLLLIAPYTPSFIRLGSRTSDGSGLIKSRTLYEVRNELKGEPLRIYQKLMGGRNSHRSLEQTQMDMRGHLSSFINDEVLSGLKLLDLKLLTQKQFESLHDEEWVLSNQGADYPQSDVCTWVGREQMCRLESRCPSINLSLEEDIEDQFERLNEIEAEIGGNSRSDDDIEALKGDFFSFRQSWTGQRNRHYNPKRIKKTLQSTPDLWDIPEEARGEIYCYLVAEAKKIMRQKLRETCKQYMRAAATMKVCKWEAQVGMISQLKTKIIGCTTTGLSKYRGLIAALKPRTLLIEEAAETVEGTVLAAMFESLDQLILVGDHQQLQAKCNRPDLSSDPYNLATSMFERLVKNKLGYTMLNQQRRMVPEIRRTFTHVYPNLSDHPSVLDRVVNRPPVPGMADTYRWFHHTWNESKRETSRCNTNEAEMVVRFFDYLILNGVDPSKITILTFYNGQKKELLKKLKKHPNLREIDYFNVFTVDSYQGEENDIILLSLVRSNDLQESGFLSNRNRAIVSLSRARRGLYIFGNILQLLPRKEDAIFKVWGPISQVFQDDKKMAEALPLTCQNHGLTVLVTEPEDYDMMGIIGGCGRCCGDVLPCGHDCPHNCHPFEHERILCKVACSRVLGCGHRCSKSCSDNCFCFACGPRPVEEFQSAFSDHEPSEWQAPPMFRQSIMHALITTPSQEQLQYSHSDNSSDLLPRNEIGNGYGNMYTPSQWTASAQAPDKLLQIARNRVATETSATPRPASRPGITDYFRQVEIINGGRGNPKKSVKRDIPAKAHHASSPAVTVTATSHPLVLPLDEDGTAATIGPKNPSLVVNIKGESLPHLSTPLSLLDLDEKINLGPVKLDMANSIPSTRSSSISKPTTPMLNSHSSTKSSSVFGADEDDLIAFD